MCSQQSKGAKYPQKSFNCADAFSIKITRFHAALKPIFRSLKPFQAFSSLFNLRARVFSFYMNTHTPLCFICIFSEYEEAAFCRIRRTIPAHKPGILLSAAERTPPSTFRLQSLFQLRGIHLCPPSKYRCCVFHTKLRRLPVRRLSAQDISEHFDIYNMQHPAFPSACQLLISLQHHGILLQRDVGRIFRRCRPIYSFFPLFSLLPLCFVHKQLLAVPHGRDDAQAAAMIIRNRTLHSGQVDAALTNHRKKLADFFVQRHI